MEIAVFPLRLRQFGWGRGISYQFVYNSGGFWADYGVNRQVAQTLQSNTGMNHNPSIFDGCLAGMSPDTGNMGVSALCYATAYGLGQHQLNRLAICDHGPGARPAQLRIGATPTAYTAVGAVNGRAWYRSNNLRQIRLAARFGGLWNPTARAILQSRALLDISGGDSFTDLYGPSRFQTVCLPKKIALENHHPLILLPQTYGPFSQPESREQAATILRGARLAIARDAQSYDRIRELLGGTFDPKKYLLGVDMAFALPPIAPVEALPEPLQSWLGQREVLPLLGVNISGLLYHQPQQAQAQFGLHMDYPTLIDQTLRALLAGTTGRIVLVQHVMAPAGHFESDGHACYLAWQRLPEHLRARVTLAPSFAHPGEVKWLISQCDWFCGARMHATIAGLSTLVPTAAMAYSIKTRGVFDTCAVGESCLEMRSPDAGEMPQRLVQHYLHRGEVQQQLQLSLPGVLDRWNAQMEQIVHTLIHAATR